MYAITTERQEALLTRLEKMSAMSDGWTETYLDRETKEEQIAFYPLSEMHGGGPRYLRKKRVPTDWREWIDQCLSSSEADDAAGIAVDLREFTGERHEIVAFLEERLANYSRNQRRTFLGSLSFASGRRNLIGRHVSEIEREWADEKRLIARIEALKKNA